MPFAASSLVTSMQTPQYGVPEYGPEKNSHSVPAFGLAGSGFGIDPASEQACWACIMHLAAMLTRRPLLQEFLGADTAPDLGEGKRRRVTERRGARSTSKYRGVTHHCRTGRCACACMLCLLCTSRC